MRRLVLAGSLVVAIVVAATALGIRSGPPPAKARDRAGLTPMQQRLLSGTASTFLDQLAAKQQLGAAAPLSEYRPTSETGCPRNRGANVRVNQECENLSDPDLAGRGQSQNETSIALDPYHPSRM